MSRDLGKTFPWLRKPEVKPAGLEVVEPRDPNWWKRPYAGHEPPEGVVPGRPWFAPSAAVWVDEAGWRWPMATLPAGVQLPAQPSGDEPEDDLIKQLIEVQRRYWDEKPEV